MEALGIKLTNFVISLSEKSIRNDVSVNVALFFFDFLPMDVVREITKDADFDTSKTLLSVSKGMNNLISNQNKDRRKLVKGVAFGKEEWLKFYDLDIGLEPMISRDIIKILNSPCHMDPTRSLRDTHILTLIPKGVSLKNLGELAKKKFPTITGYGYAYQPILDELETLNDKSYWALMSKDVINGSGDESFEKQQEIVAKLSQNANVNCEVPSALEAAISILTHQVRLGERLFCDNPITFTRCLEVYKGCRLLVGCFTPSGLDIDDDGYGDSSSIGVAVMRKFRPLSLVSAIVRETGL